MRNKRVSIGSEADEPVPVLREAEQNGGSVEAERDRGGAFVVGEVGPPDNVNILGGLEDGVGLDGEGEVVAIGVGGGGVEVEEVEVEGVVGGAEQAEDPGRVAVGAGDEVGEGGRGGGGGFVGVEDGVEEGVRAGVGRRGGEGEGEDEGEGEEGEEEEGVEEEGGFGLWISEVEEGGE